jgi:pimeloyl-ACP methyl ester carboxylesterase
MTRVRGRPSILLYGFGVDGLGQFGDFERILPLAEKRQEMFREVFGTAPPLPNPPLEGRQGAVRALRAAGARTILPDMRGFAASDKSREKTAYADSAMARDFATLIDHLRLDAVDVIGFSMGSGTAARLLGLRPPQVKSGILAGVGDYALEDGVLEFPKNWPIPDSVPRPLNRRVSAEEGARILEQGEIVPGHHASANLIAARVTGADPKVLVAVMKYQDRYVDYPECFRRPGRHECTSIMGEPTPPIKRSTGFSAIPTARSAASEGDHHSTPYQPTFQQAVVEFF